MTFLNQLGRSLSVLALFVTAIPLMPDASHAAAPRFRNSNLGRDFSIRATLTKALTASLGKVPAVQSNAGVLSITFNNDKLSCDSTQKCSLQWDTVTANSPKDAGDFHAALYDVLYYYAQGEGKSDPALQLSVFSQTGSIQLKIRELPGNDDYAVCIFLNPNRPGSYKDCTLVVSDYGVGTQADLRTVYDQMLGAKSLIDAQKNAVIASVTTPDFQGNGGFMYGNGTIEVQRTLYTDLLMDGIETSAYYGYKAPIVDNSGRVISDGIRITLSGSQTVHGLVLQQLQFQSYLLPHHE